MGSVLLVIICARLWRTCKKKKDEMRNEEFKSYVKTLFAVLVSVGFMLLAVWWYWTRNADDIVARVLRSSRKPEVLDELGVTLGHKGAEALSKLILKNK